MGTCVGPGGRVAVVTTVGTVVGLGVAGVVTRLVFTGVVAGTPGCRLSGCEIRCYYQPADECKNNNHQQDDRKGAGQF